MLNHFSSVCSSQMLAGSPPYQRGADRSGDLALRCECRLANENAGNDRTEQLQVRRTPQVWLHGRRQVLQQSLKTANVRCV